jgi:hypothetical protein
MGTKRIILWAWAALFACAAPAWAPADEQGKAPAPPQVSDSLESLILDRPEVPVTKADNARPVKPQPVLPPDGSMVIDRSCTIRSDAASGWIVVEFPDEPGRRREEPRWVLPCERLEKMETVVAERPDTVFRLTGENLVYRGKLFLLISRDPVVVTSEAGPRTDVAAEAPGRPATKPAPEQKSPEAEGPASRPGQIAGKEASADDIFQALMRQRPGKPMDTSNYQPRKPAAEPSVAPKPPGAEEAPSVSAAMVVGRIVRMPPVGPDGWREVRFKSDNTLLEPPLRLLPCSPLERAEEYGGLLHISGIVTGYKGQRYLLLRKVVRERDMGQF